MSDARVLGGETPVGPNCVLVPLPLPSLGFLVCWSGIRRSRHWRASTPSSISAMFSQLPCLGCSGFPAFRQCVSPRQARRPRTGTRGGGVQIVHHQDYPVFVRVVHIHQLSHHPGPVSLGSLGHLQDPSKGESLRSSWYHGSPRTRRQGGAGLPHLLLAGPWFELVLPELEGQAGCTSSSCQGLSSFFSAFGAPSDAVHYLTLHQPVSQQLQRPTGTVATSEVSQVGLSLAVQLPGPLDGREGLAGGGHRMWGLLGRWGTSIGMRGCPRLRVWS